MYYSYIGALFFLVGATSALVHAQAPEDPEWTVIPSRFHDTDILGMDGDVIGVIPRRDTVLILDYNADLSWFSIEYNGVIGRIPGRSGSFLVDGQISTYYDARQWFVERALYAERDRILSIASASDHGIIVRNQGIYDISPQGGIYPYVRWANASDRTVRRIQFTLLPYNGVGEQERCTVTGRSSVQVELVGPFEPLDPDQPIRYTPSTYSSKELYERHTFQRAWWNPEIRCLELRRVDVQYMDGTRYSYVRELPLILHPDNANDCSYPE